MEYKETIDKLTNDGAIYRCQGIIDCLKKHITDQQVVEAIGRLKNDNVVILGRRVSSYALAALDIIGVEKYSGNDDEVRELIPDLTELIAS